MAHACGVLLLVSMLAFLFADLAPGDPFSAERLNPRLSDETLDAWRARAGADFHKKTLEILNARGIYHPTFQSYAIEFTTNDQDDVTEDSIREELRKAGGADYGTGTRNN